jgi:hypothetical protein
MEKKKGNEYVRNIIFDVIPIDAVLLPLRGQNAVKPLRVFTVAGRNRCINEPK